MDAAKFDAMFPINATLEATNAAFKIWMAKVDAILVNKCGFDSRDLPDWMYCDAFDDGMSPATAAKKALKAAKEF